MTKQEIFNKYKNKETLVVTFIDTIFITKSEYNEIVEDTEDNGFVLIKLYEDDAPAATYLNCPIKCIYTLEQYAKRIKFEIMLLARSVFLAHKCPPNEDFNFDELDIYEEKLIPSLRKFDVETQKIEIRAGKIIEYVENYIDKIEQQMTKDKNEKGI